MKKLILVLLIATGLQAYAGGYRVALQGARLLGMGHAGTGLFSNAETLFFNPSGIAYLQGKYQFSAGLNFVLSNVRYQNAQTYATAETHNPVGTPFYLYATMKATDNLYFGLGIYTPFGSTIKWDKDWAGSHLVNTISLTAIYTQLSMTYRFNPYFSVSASFISATGSIDLDKNINRFQTDENGNRTGIELQAKGITGSGYVLSASIRPSDKFSLGLTYRSKIIFRARYGEAVFRDQPAYFPDRDAFTAELPMPAEFDLGMAWKPLDKLTLAADMNYTYWSVYKKLDIKFNRLGETVLPKHWQNTYTWRFGAEYALSDALQIRAGYYTDQSPIPATYFSPETPSLDTRNFTFGFSYTLHKITLDAAFLYVNGKERTDSYDYYKEGLSTPRFSGTYVENAFVPSFGISYKL